MKNLNLVEFKQLWKSILFFTVALITIIPQQLQAREVFFAGKFSAAGPGEVLPTGWEPLIFKKINSHTHYSLIKDGDTPVVQAVSKGSASGLMRKIRVDPEKYPIIRWRWKAENILQNGNVTKKSEDDYPARVYITFEYDSAGTGFIDKAKFLATKQVYGEYPSIATINYIWANKAPVGTFVISPYSKRDKMIVVESGEEKLNTWVVEERNIFADYVTAFGQKPPMISGIAIMTDSDNTKESATAFYGDIIFASTPIKK